MIFYVNSIICVLCVSGRWWWVVAAEDSKIWKHSKLSSIRHSLEYLINVDVKDLQIDFPFTFLSLSYFYAAPLQHPSSKPNWIPATSKSKKGKYKCNYPQTGVKFAYMAARRVEKHFNFSIPLPLFGFANFFSFFFLHLQWRPFNVIQLTDTLENSQFFHRKIKFFLISVLHQKYSEN